MDAKTQELKRRAEAGDEEARHAYMVACARAGERVYAVQCLRRLARCELTGQHPWAVSRERLFLCAAQAAGECYEMFSNGRHVSVVNYTTSTVLLSFESLERWDVVNFDETTTALERVHALYRVLQDS